MPLMTPDPSTPGTMVATHTGCVLTTYELNGHDDSDFYAVIYHPATATEPARIEDHLYASTRCHTGMDAKVDATPETIALANAFLLEWGAVFERRLAENRARLIQKHRRVTVVKGRNVPIGTEGLVVYVGVPIRQKGGNWTTSLTIATTDRTEPVIQLGKYSSRFENKRYLDTTRVYLDNCVLTDWAQHMEDDRTIAWRAKDWENRWTYLREARGIIRQLRAAQENDDLLVPRWIAEQDDLTVLPSWAPNQFIHSATRNKSIKLSELPRALHMPSVAEYALTLPEIA